tara:strand:- start:694 stop:1692 length:999 start_codon:yes stop_codon:yes gene_type:complete
MRALVTGGGGFLGQALVRRLVSKNYDVVSLTRQHYSALAELGVEQVQGSIADEETVSNAAQGADVIFHVAAKAGMWGPYSEYFQTNVVGTENVIAACRQHGINRLVYTSTPSVVHGGGSIEGQDESLPYAETFLAHYPRTKVLAEQAVLAANDEALATVALRPHLIWGPGDNHLAPRMIARQKMGRLRLIGNGENLVDSVFVENAVDAHLCAFEKLNPGSVCSGKAYFISQDEPLPVKTLMNGILESAGLEPVTKSIAPGLAYFVGLLFETTYGTFGVKSEPMMTRFLAKQLATAHWFNIQAAKNDLGYKPSISVREGMDILRQHYHGEESG